MPRPRVVLDTNVVVSAHLNDQGYERFVLDLCFARKVQICISSEVLEEYVGVLGREEFHIQRGRLDASLGLIVKPARMVQPSKRLRAARHAEDNKFLECALESAADYLVTGNKRHFPRRFGVTRVINAREFLETVIPDLRR